ncbi:MAG: gamma-glutamyl-gamma-aminobutyrate hydrolase family protein [Myxococcota bacterium]
MPKPFILVIPPFEGEFQPKTDTFPHIAVREFYTDSIISAGGLPLIAALRDDKTYVERLIAISSGILLAGNSGQIDPTEYGEKPSIPDKEIDKTRYPFTKRLLSKAFSLGMPVFGICHGLQEINVFLGGSLYQNLTKEFKSDIEHYQNIDSRTPVHKVAVKEDSLIAKICGKNVIAVNSVHRQGIKRLGRGVECAASAPDGVVEAIEVRGLAFCIGVQWHPERLKDEASPKLFERFVKQCRKYLNRRS